MIENIIISIYIWHRQIESFLCRKPGVGILSSLFSFFAPFVKTQTLMINSELLSVSLAALQALGLILGLYIGFLTIKVKSREARNLDHQYKILNNGKEEKQ